MFKLVSIVNSNHLNHIFPIERLSMDMIEHSNKEISLVLSDIGELTKYTLTFKLYMNR